MASETHYVAGSTPMTMGTRLSCAVVRRPHTWRASLWEGGRFGEGVPRRTRRFAIPVARGECLGVSMTSPATGGRIPRPLGLILIHFEQKLSRRVNPGKNRASELYHERLSCKGKGPGNSCGAKRQTDEEVHQAPQNRKKKEENMSWKWRNSRTRGA